MVKKKNKKDINEYSWLTPRSHKIGIFILVIGGIGSLIGGIQMVLNNEISQSFVGGGRFSTGITRSINGPTAIFFGIIFLLYPIYILLKRIFHSKN